LVRLKLGERGVTQADKETRHVLYLLGRASTAPRVKSQFQRLESCCEVSFLLVQ
jgi:hypothetical protein